MKVLNLYAGIGGNRKLWPDDKIDVMAIENNKQIAKIYHENFPNDTVKVTDAHRFLLNHFDEFDFIWSSPPCPSHSKMRLLSIAMRQSKPIFPNMELYEEILFCQQYVKCKWVIENIISWYKPLIMPYVSGRHYFWSNFHISNLIVPPKEIKGHNIKAKEKRKGFLLPKIRMKHSNQILNNCVDSMLGLHVFNCAFKVKQTTLAKIINPNSS